MYSAPSYTLLPSAADARDSFHFAAILDLNLFGGEIFISVVAGGPPDSNSGARLKEFPKSRRMTVVARNWNQSNLLTINNSEGMSVKNKWK